MKSTVMLCLALLLTGGAAAQEMISVGDSEIARLDIRFAAGQPVHRHSGERFPGQVVRSPDAAGALRTIHAGQVNTWHAQPGEGVAAGDRVVSLRSEALLQVQREWLDARAAAQQALAVLERDRALFEAGVIAGQRLERAERDHRLAANAERAAADRLTVAGVSESDRRQLLEDGTVLGRYTLRAIQEGVLTHRVHAVSEWVEAGDSLAMLAVGDRQWLRFHLPVRLARTLARGDVLQVDGAPAAVEVRRRDFEAEPGTQMVEVLAQFRSDSDRMTGEILDVIVPPTDEGLLIPGSAVVRDGEDSLVFVRHASGVEVRRLSVQSAGAEYLVREGLSGDEQVAVQGTAALKGMLLGLGGGE